MVYENALNIYTDGSSLPHPRRGGIGFRFVTIDDSGNEVTEDHAPPGYKGATNNEMELMACIQALKETVEHPKIKSVDRIYVVTDSLYVKDNLPRAIYQWSGQRWLNNHGRPVENAALWKELVRLVKKAPRKVEFKWVQGHSKNQHNKAADKLAKQSAKGALNLPLKPVTVRRKITEHSVERGSVKMEGQVLSIRIVTDSYLKLQKLYRYRCEVLAGGNAYLGKVDWIDSEQLLRAGHHYEVRVNNDTTNPRIVEVFREMERS